MRCRFFASERHNLLDDLCLIDPPDPVISFGGEPVKIICMKSIKKYFLVLYQTGPKTPWWLREFSIFCVAKIKKENKGKSFKAETIKRLLPRLLF